MSPITLSIDVSEVQARLLAQRDISSSTRDLPRYERPSSSRTFVVEENTIAREHAISFSVVDCYPVTVKLRDTIWRTGVKRCCLALRSFNDLSVEFGSGRLVETDVFVQTTCSNGIKQTQGSKAINVSGVFGHFKRDFDVRLGAEIVHFCWLNLSNDVHEIGTI